MLGESLVEDLLSYPRMRDGSKIFGLPPLLSYLHAVSFKIFGVSECSARIVIIAFSAIAILFIFLLGRELYTPRVGLASAAVMAFTPMFIVVGRNFQTDMVCTALILVSLYLYVKSGKEGTSRGTAVKYMIASGALLGLSLLAKQTAVLVLFALAVWETVVKRKLRWIRREHMLFLASMLAVLSPYLIYMLLESSEDFLKEQLGRFALAYSAEGGSKGVKLLVREWFWAYSPLLAVASLVSLYFPMRSRSTQDKLVLVFTAVFSGIFLFYNKHSYYLLPAFPFISLLVGRMIGMELKGRPRVALLAVLVLSGMFYSGLVLCGNKYGYTAFAGIKDVIRKEDAGSASILMMQNMLWNYGTIVEYYNPGKQVINLNQTQTDEKGMSALPYDKPLYMAMFASSMNPDKAPPQYKTRLLEGRLNSSKYSLTLFGRSLFQVPANRHFFLNGRLQSGKSGLPFTAFGIHKLNEYPTLYVIKLDANERIFMDTEGGREAFEIRTVN